MSGVRRDPTKLGCSSSTTNCISKGWTLISTRLSTNPRKERPTFNQTDSFSRKCHFGHCLPMTLWASVDSVFDSRVFGMFPVALCQIAHPTDASTRGSHDSAFLRPIQRIVDSSLAHHYVITTRILQLKAARNGVCMVVEIHPRIILIEIQQQAHAQGLR